MAQSGQKAASHWISLIFNHEGERESSDKEYDEIQDAYRQPSNWIVSLILLYHHLAPSQPFIHFIQVGQVLSHSLSPPWKPSFPRESIFFFTVREWWWCWWRWGKMGSKWMGKVDDLWFMRRHSEIKGLRGKGRMRKQQQTKTNGEASRLGEAAECVLGWTREREALLQSIPYIFFLWREKIQSACVFKSWKGWGTFLGFVVPEAAPLSLACYLSQAKYHFNPHLCCWCCCCCCYWLGSWRWWWCHHPSLLQIWIMMCLDGLLLLGWLQENKIARTSICVFLDEKMKSKRVNHHQLKPNPKSFSHPNPKVWPFEANCMREKERDSQSCIDEKSIRTDWVHDGSL